MIGPAATVKHFQRRRQHFARARDAWAAVLARQTTESDVVLLPAYVGHTTADGSGIFDPVEASRRRFDFYEIDGSLAADVTSVEERLVAHRDTRCCVLAVNYFGWPQPHLHEMAVLTAEHGAMLVEDNAHALLTDLAYGTCGRSGSFAFGSIHKLLPVMAGGVLLDNRCAIDEPNGPDIGSPLEDFDLLGIARHRQRVASALVDQLGRRQELASRVRPLHPSVPIDIAPQSVPLVIDDQAINRDQVHAGLRALGVGATSLYYNLISPLYADRYRTAQALSHTILNLPCHQDVRVDDIEPMLDAMALALATASPS